jgi:hypothetical protein
MTMLEELFDDMFASIALGKSEESESMYEAERRMSCVATACLTVGATDLNRP